MLLTHKSLRIVVVCAVLLDEQILIFQVWQGNDDALVGSRLKTHLAVPSHVLNGGQCSIGQDIHVESTIGYKNTVCGFDHAGENELNWIGGFVVFVFRTAYRKLAYVYE